MNSNDDRLKADVGMIKWLVFQVLRHFRTQYNNISFMTYNVFIHLFIYLLANLFIYQYLIFCSR